MRNPYGIMLLALALALLAAPAVLGQTAPAQSALEARVDQLFAPWDKAETPGCALAVVRNGQILYKRGYGMANLEYDVPITPATIFHVASISKQFTAMAVTMLAREGKLALDDDIRKYLPEVPDFGPRITLRHLLYHTSGLRDQWNLLTLAGWRMEDVITERDILELVARQRELNFSPGAEHLYCNTGRMTSSCSSGRGNPRRRSLRPRRRSSSCQRAARSSALRSPPARKSRGRLPRQRP